MKLVLRAARQGSLAAVGGALLYFAVAKVTGYEIGLIGIAVEIMVGIAVRRGAGRGGPLFQGIAMFLTYTAIVSTYVPAILDAVRSSHSSHAAASAEAPAQSSAPAEPRRKSASPAKFALALLLLAITAYLAPFLAGFKNIMGIIIIGISVYQAWKLNRPLRLSMGKMSHPWCRRPRLDAGDRLRHPRRGRTCACGADVPVELVACPGCRRLFHAEELKRLAADGERHERGAPFAGACGLSPRAGAPSGGLRAARHALGARSPPL